MRKLAVSFGLAALLLCACQKTTELASEANAVYERGVEPKLPPASVTLESVPEVAPPPEDAPVDGTPAPAAVDASAPAPTDGAAPADASGAISPKSTPDTVRDYRPAVSDQISALPPVSDAAGLARSFLQWNGRASGSPGSYEAGAVQLGADERQYKPSDAELVAAEAGDRLSAAVNGADQATKDAVNAVLGTDASGRAYKRFDYRHSDVMGSGRYFYASAPKDASVPN
ncbi:MAG TPA: hypothetical protein VGO52_14360 [Hyphomonadaceae bacterium]|jgi:hypothetical protein|nr:hypothetical protein [Hyphomonadaceae bacterium]